MSSPPTKTDQRIRQAAYAYIRKLVAKHEFLTKEQLWPDVFASDDENFSLIHPRRGRHKPARMSHLLSLLSQHSGATKYETKVPKIPAQEESASFYYQLVKGRGPDYPDNRYMREAYEWGVPILLFLEPHPRSPSRSLRFFPTLARIVSWEPEPSKHRAKVRYSRIDISVEDLDLANNTLGRRYGRAERKQRLHQEEFRKALISAYQERCSMSGLSGPELLEAAHITPDYQGGQPKTSNGLLLSKIHHAAFDAHLIGITPDYRVKVSKRLLEEDSRKSDLLALLKKINGERIRLPQRREDYPSQDALKERYEIFQEKEGG